MVAEPIQIYEGNYWMDAFSWNEDDGCDAANSLGVPGFPDTEFIFHEIYDNGHHGAQFRVTSTNTGLTYLCNLTGDEYYCPPVSTLFGHAYRGHSSTPQPAHVSFIPEASPGPPALSLNPALASPAYPTMPVG